MPGTGACWGVLDRIGNRIAFKALAPAAFETGPELAREPLPRAIVATASPRWRPPKSMSSARARSGPLLVSVRLDSVSDGVGAWRQSADTRSARACSTRARRGASFYGHPGRFCGRGHVEELVLRPAAQTCSAKRDVPRAGAGPSVPAHFHSKRSQSPAVAADRLTPHGPRVERARRSLLPMPHARASSSRTS